MTGPARRTLHVVTHRRWVADELADGARCRPDLGVAVRHHLGMDLPVFAPGDTLWAPMDWAARARAAAHPGPEPTAPSLLTDPGAHWLTTLPREVLARTVDVMPLRQVQATAPGTGFFKPANAKIERLPAAWRTRADFEASAAEIGMPEDSLVLVADRFLDLAEEHRVHVLRGQPVTSSPYLLRDGDGTETLWHETMTSDHDEQARRFAAAVLAAPGLRTPPAMVLDVAMVATTPASVADGTAGRWVVLESNPVWSSGFYGADLGAVAECLVAAVDGAPEHGRWRWQPDPWLVRRAEQQRPLSSPLSSLPCPPPIQARAGEAPAS